MSSAPSAEDTPSAPTAVGELQRLLDDVESIQPWPPGPAAGQMEVAVRRLFEVVDGPPGPTPEAVTESADEWHRIGTAAGRAHEHVVALGDDVGDDVWQGESGDAYRRSVDGLGRQIEVVPATAYDVGSALDTLADDLRAARHRWSDGFHALHRVDWGGSEDDPDAWSERISDSRAVLAGSVRELVGAHEDAEAAHLRTREEIGRTVDGVDADPAAFAAAAAAARLAAPSLARHLRRRKEGERRSRRRPDRERAAAVVPTADDVPSWGPGGIGSVTPPAPPAPRTPA